MEEKKNKRLSATVRVPLRLEIEATLRGAEYDVDIFVDNDYMDGLPEIHVADEKALKEVLMKAAAALEKGGLDELLDAFTPDEVASYAEVPKRRDPFEDPQDASSY